MALPLETIAELNELACAYYEAELLRHAAAAAYVRSRGLTEATISRWRLGYAPGSSRALLRHLGDLGWPESTLVEAGLAGQGERGAYDAFIDRVVCPIIDRDGRRILGFSGRALQWEKGDPFGKYKNTAETPLFDKSRALYGLPNVTSIKRAADVWVVEGNFDMLALYNAGVHHVVAACGTAITEQHLDLLAELTPRVTLLLDVDEAGRAATRKTLLLPGIETLDAGVITLESGKDAADLLAADPAAWQHLPAKRQPRWEYLWSMAASAHPTALDDVEERVAWKDDWAPLVRDHAPDRATAEQLLHRLELALALPDGLLAHEYLGAREPGALSPEELLLIALAADWPRLAPLAPYVAVSLRERGAKPLLDSWVRSGAAELPSKLARAREPQAGAARVALMTAWRGGLRARLKQRRADLLRDGQPSAEAAGIAAVLQYLR